MLPPNMPLVNAALVGSCALQSLQQKSVLADKFRFGTVTSVENLACLKADWQRLEDTSSTGIHVFQSYDWCMAWAECAARAKFPFAPCVVTGHVQNKLAFIWPLMSIRLFGLRLLRWLSEPWAQYGDVLVSPEHVSALMDAALQYLRRERMADCIWLRHVREDAACHKFLATSFKLAGYSDGAPYMDLSNFTDEDSYFARYNSEQRQRRRRARRKLEAALGPVGFELHGQSSAFNGLWPMSSARNVFG